MTKLSLTALALLVPACTTDLATDADEQAIGPATQVDYNADGIETGADAVSFLESWGLKIYSYGVTDDRYNPGLAVGRRPYDFQVKTYGDPCLPSGVSPQAFPPDEIPGIVDLANQYARLPTQYLRDLGSRGYSLFFFGELGRVLKRWYGTANTTHMELLLYRDAAGVHATGRFGTADVPYEVMDQVSYDGVHGQIWFHRPSANQFYSAQVDATGTYLTGTFTQNGVSYHIAASAWNRGAGTTAPGGFGAGDVTACDEDNTHAPYHWGFGRTSPGILLQVGGLGNLTSAHELGHTIRYIVDDKRLGFTTADANRIEQLFPRSGSAAAYCAGCTDAQKAIALLGSGYVSNYAASPIVLDDGTQDDEEDFAETFGYWVTNPGLIDQRIQQDASWNGSTVLRDKRDFVKHVIDTPDPGPAAAAHPASHTSFRFMPGHYSTLANPTVRAIPNGKPTRMGYAVASDGANKLWLVTTATDNIVYVQTVDGNEQFSMPVSLGLVSDMPATATSVGPNAMAVFVVVDGVIDYRILDASGVPFSSGTIIAAPTSRPVAAATLNGTTYLFALDGSGNVSYQRLTYDGVKLNQSSWSNLGITATALTATKVVTPTGVTQIDLVAIDNTLDVRYDIIDTSGTFGGWTYDPLFALATSQPAVDGAGTLFIKGFDGNIYTHLLGSTTAYKLLAGL